MTYDPCPICGYTEMPYPPVPENICPCCGTEFGVDDDDHSPEELRCLWIDNDFSWFSDLRRPPKEWSPYRQLIIANHGVDLISHRRFRTDQTFRSALNKAFSEVRIAKQLKVLRETRKEPLTQAQLADKADMKQSRISELEGMNYSSWSISTIERLATAMGIGIKYSFAGWGELVAEIEGGLSREKLYIPAFEDDPVLKVKSSANGDANNVTSIQDYLKSRSQGERLDLNPEPQPSSELAQLKGQRYGNSRG